MDQPVYWRRLLQQKVLLIIGLVVAIAAGLFAGFTIDNGQIVPRAVKTYTAATTVLLTSPQPDYFQVEIPGQTQALPTENPDLVTSESTPVDLSQSAIILAYLASSDEVVDAAEKDAGGIQDGESITSLRRTTQPGGDETFPGRLTLPIIDIIGVSTVPSRAVELSDDATKAFTALVEQKQTEWGVAEDIRLKLQVLTAPVADDGVGSNPAIPVVVVAIGVFLLFIAAALIAGAVSDRRRARRAAKVEAVVSGASGPGPRRGADPASDEPVPAPAPAAPAPAEPAPTAPAPAQGTVPPPARETARDTAPDTARDASFDAVPERRRRRVADGGAPDDGVTEGVSPVVDLGFDDEQWSRSPEARG